jgi:hypothetical protein
MTRARVAGNMGVYGLGMCRPVCPRRAWRACMTWGHVCVHDLGMRVAWGCIDLYDLGSMCGLGICKLVRPRLHVGPRLYAGPGLYV